MSGSSDPTACTSPRARFRYGALATDPIVASPAARRYVVVDLPTLPVTATGIAGNRRRRCRARARSAAFGTSAAYARQTRVCGRATRTTERTPPPTGCSLVGRLTPRLSHSRWPRRPGSGHVVTGAAAPDRRSVDAGLDEP
jgi:hypothetical protein